MLNLFLSAVYTHFVNKLENKSKSGVKPIQPIANDGKKFIPKCFRCGEMGHTSRVCTKQISNLSDRVRPSGDRPPASAPN